MNNLQSDKIEFKKSDDSDIEENSGVDFPGTQFDAYLHKTFKDMSSQLGKYDLIVVE